MNSLRRCALSLCLCYLATAFACNGNDGGGGATENGGGETQPSAAAYMPEGGVLPTPETIEGGAYTPMSRPLFVYVNTESLKKPEVAAFLRYYLSPEGQDVVTEIGYVRLSADQLAETTGRLEGAIAEAGTSDPGQDLSGQVIIDGSSTVEPISAAISEMFGGIHRGVRVPVGTSGTGGGFDKFLRGETDINDASRPIKDSEVATAQTEGVEFVELKVAIDGLTVVVNPDNDWCDGLTVAQLQQIWEHGSQVTRWNQIMPEWPDEEIELFGPDTDSGTYDYFVEEICGESGSRSDYQPSVDDNQLVRGVAGSKYALGYFGYAYYVENADELKALAIAPE